MGAQGGLPWELEEAWRRVTCEPGPMVASGSSSEPGQEDGAGTGGQKGACTQKPKHEDRRVPGGGWGGHLGAWIELSKGVLGIGI